MVEPTGYTALDLIGFTDKGSYDPLANYVRNDLVHVGNSTWRCKIDDTTGITPTEGANWTIFIESATSLSGMSDVDLNTPKAGDGLVHNGNDWTNIPIMTKEQWKKNGAYNLCSNEKLTTQVLNGITITFNPTGYPKGCVKLDTGSGTATTGTWINVNYKTMELVTGQTYRMVGVENGDVSTYRLTYSDGVTTEAIYDGGVNFVCGDASNTQVNIYVSSGASLSNVIVKPMITTDLNATYDDYVPYAKTNRKLTEDKYLDNSSSYTSLDTTITNTFTAPADGLYLIAAKCNNATSTADVYLQNGSSPILSVLGVDILSTQLVYLKAGTTLYTRSDKGTYVVRGYYKV